ncbi:iron uptake transporter deferrochelatase/peroxidase subunit [Streptomyces sp. ASQP_92]|uniref:iron uptake transporter deferrochelatase/peroxidase subunit n=1 Tax=Streptomyces sp. ASQP_92 TaxID=2979116 RepID=UPI0021C14E53|nr:iron uptake transporter deferrochelatase/peroxidase subunit [Streptomyces sp. ASQP_92]MCT9089033.1 iron uptake transporter deferrochelatase/peroxidase subunit [Streptomyces sp. ASQP_92]
MSEVRRRGFLRGAAAGVGTAVTGAALSGAIPRPARAGNTASITTSPDFHGTHQAGILQLPRRATALVSFDVTAADRRELTELMRALTDRARFLAVGGSPVPVGITAPPSDSGVLGPQGPTGGVTITAGVGAALFDDRFGLKDRKPARLTTMPAFPDDDLDPAWCHGDLSLQLCADSPDIVLHALRDITRHTRGGMQVRWRMDGFTSPPRPSGTPRNHLGFKDGTANPDTADRAAMDRLVWVGQGGAEPAWAAGGSYLVVRLIRMLVEFWDRVSLAEQERMIGRARDTGAPLDGAGEFDVPKFAQDPKGDVIPLDSHIRLANPRSGPSESRRILRRGYNYDRGMDTNGDLDMGLLFCCYQQDLARQFEAVQKRLAGEPLADYIKPFGGGYFLALPGVRDRSDWLGRTLLL